MKTRYCIHCGLELDPVDNDGVVIHADGYVECPPAFFAEAEPGE